MISRNFIKSSLIYTLAGALPMASAIILLPLYIAYLPTELYGVLSLCLAFSILVQIIVTYSFDTSLYIHYHEFKHQPEKLSSFISSVFIFMLALGAVVSLFFALAGNFVFDIVFPEKSLSFYPYGMAAIGIGVFQAIFKVKGNLLQTRQQPEVFLWSNVISFALIAATTIAGLKLFPGTLIGPLGGRLLAAAASAIWALVRTFREFGFHARSPWHDTSSSFNAYTFIYQVQQWTINYLDRFLLLFFLPLSTVGVYDFALKCVVPIELILNGLNATINPKVVSLITSQNEKGATPEINRYFYGLVSVILLIICVTILLVPLLLDLFIESSGYGLSVQYIPYVALVYILKSMRLYFVVPFTVLKKMQRITILNFIIALFKILLMVLLIKNLQLFGVIISAYLAYSFEIVLLWRYLTEYYTIKFNVVKLILVPGLVFFMILIPELLVSDDMTLLAHAAYAVLCFGLLALAYKNELKLINPFKR